MLTQDVQSYLAVRRAMGFALHSEGTLLQSLAAFSEDAGKTHVCTETAIEWAGSARSTTTRARRKNKGENYYAGWASPEDRGPQETAVRMDGIDSRPSSRLHFLGAV